MNSEIPVCPFCKKELIYSFERNHGEDYYCEDCDMKYYESQIDWKIWEGN